MNNNVYGIDTIIGQLLSLLETGYTYVHMQINPQTGRLDVIPLETKSTLIQDVVDVLVTVLMSGHTLVTFEEEWNEEANHYSLAIFPVEELASDFEPYKVNLKEIELN